MLITAICPRCETSYQVQDSLRGKPMRCPLTTCKHVFIVGEEPRPQADTPDSSAPPPSRPNTGHSQQTGSVGELIPLLPLDESASPEPEPEPLHVSEVITMLHAELIEPGELPDLETVEPDQSSSPPPSWMEAPPPVRRGESAPLSEEPHDTNEPNSTERKKRREPARTAAREAPLAPPDEGHHSWNPPPVRGGTEEQAEVEQETEHEPEPRSRRRRRDEDADEHRHEEKYDYEPVHTPRGALAKWVIIPIVVFTLGALGVGGYFVWTALSQNEERLAKEADEQYDRGLFRDAGKLYGDLVKNFETSESLPRYKFRKEISEIRQRVGDRPESPNELLDHLDQFMKDYEKDPLLSEHGYDIGETLIKLMVEFCEGVREPTDESPLKVLSRAGEVVARAKKIKLPKGAKAPEWSKLDESFGMVQDAIARLQRRKAVIKRLGEIAKHPSYPAILEAESLVRDEEVHLPGLKQLPEVQKLLADLITGHKESVQYRAEPAHVPPAERGSGPEEPAILFDPRIQGTPGNAPPQDRIVLALARGVLYALRQTTGEVKWARRLGIDTTNLPVRVPASLGSVERILVLSSDTSTLSAVDVNNNTLWRYRLGTPSLGRPVVVNQRAYLATYSGEVHEIELVEGKLLGRYPLGQPLTLGGTREPGTNRIFFPADEGCVYVLDVKERRCDLILYTRHPGGSLRGEPIVVAPEGESSPGYLILNQTNGLGNMQLRVFELPLNDRNGAERPLDADLVVEKTLNPKAELDGWTWFQPYYDTEKVVMLTDAGMLGLFGIRQRSNTDKPLYPLLPEGGLALRSILGGPETAERMHGRAQVAQMQDNDLWVLAADKLQRLRLAWGFNVGPRVVPVWKEPLEVGSPLHGSQLVPERDVPRMSLITVTRPARRSTCWATSVDDQSGVLNWQRQLGLVCASAPVALKTDKGDPLFLALDQGGALLCLDPSRYTVKPDTQWMIATQNVFVAESLDENPRQEPSLLPADDGKSAWVVACPRGGLDLVVRHVKPADGVRRLEVSESSARLPSTLAGTPAVVGSSLILPLADGVLARLPLPIPPNANPETVPNWRTERAPPDTIGHVLALGGDRFLTTDGGRGLIVWEWPAGNPVWNVLPAARGGAVPTLGLTDRIVSAPLRLPGAPGALVQVCVADAGGNVSLIEVQNNGDLVVKKTWAVGGMVTTGPFIADPVKLRIGAVVEKSRLVWIDPVRDAVLWSYHTEDDDPIVGTPRVAEGMVVVTDQSGLYVGIDPERGEKKGPGYRLRGSVAPVAGPVAFSKGRLLAPLSDGTVMLLSARRLEPVKKK